MNSSEIKLKNFSHIIFNHFLSFYLKLFSRIYFKLENFKAFPSFLSGSRRHEYAANVLLLFCFLVFKYFQTFKQSVLLPRFRA